MLRRPQEELALDPLFHANVRLFIRDVLELEIVQGLERGPFCLAGRPINSVQLVGTVVSVCMKTNRREDGGFRKGQDYVEFLLDDGTGLLTCLYWPRQTLMEEDGRTIRKMVDKGLETQAMKALVLGACVVVLGSLQALRSRDGGKLWRLEASGLRAAAGPCEEVLHWLEAVRFHKHILPEQDPVDPPAPPVRRETQCGCALWAALHYCCCQDVSGSPESMLMPELLRWLLQRLEGDGGGTVRAEAYSELKIALEQRARQILATEQGGASGGAEVGVVSWGEARWRAELSMLFQRSLKRLKDQGLITFSTDGSQVTLRDRSSAKQE